MSQLILLIISALFCFYWGDAAPVADKITYLPGLTAKINFNQYAGYVPVNAQRSKNLFYWFVESQSNPATDPLFLWLQGGPGCSSLLGFFTELGPFRVGSNKTISVNPNSWNKKVNYLFLESPAGVGFSYDTSGDYTTGDNQTANDAYNFLQQWFQLFPEYSKHDFYITGESYGGHYVPQLASTILHYNKANPKIHIPLKGILVGNPYTDDKYDSDSLPYFLFYHHLVSVNSFDAVQRSCNLTGESHVRLAEPFREFKTRKLVSTFSDCDAALNRMFAEVGDNTNQYHIYTSCVEGKGLDCIDYSNELAYLNSDDVQKSIHAKKPAVPWTICSSTIKYLQSYPTVLNLYPELMDNLHVTVYGGDVTYNVPVLGTERWVNDLGRNITQAWKKWDIGGQVAGYYIKYQGITFVSVKDSGHMVPFYTPVSAEELLRQYLKGEF